MSSAGELRGLGSHCDRPDAVAFSKVFQGSDLKLCHKVSRRVSGCFVMCHDVSRCVRLFQNVSRCFARCHTFTMFTRCVALCQNVSQCVTVWNMCHCVSESYRIDDARTWCEKRGDHNGLESSCGIDSIERTTWNEWGDLFVYVPLRMALVRARNFHQTGSVCFRTVHTSSTAQGRGRSFRKGNLSESLIAVNHGWQSESTDAPKGGWSCVFWSGCNACSGHLTHNCWM